MSKRILVAGATGVIGRRLLPLLQGAGHHVVAITRSGQKRLDPRHGAAEMVTADVFDADAVLRIMASVRPDVVVHQLTDLSGLADPATAADAIRRNARIRIEGTRNLVKAALAADVRRMVAQSIAWAYAPGPLPHAEEDALDSGAGEPRSITIGGVSALEQAVLHSPPIKGTILRYGQLYGPGTSRDQPTGSAPLHVDAAAYAALLAVERDAPGIFNIAEPGPEVLTDKARSRLGWRADMRLPVAAA
jgi:nucleoside-diphosphate-sugar epimerase